MTEKNDNEMNEEIIKKINDDGIEDPDSNESDNLRLKTEELQESILRLNADIENLRKRNLKDIENAARSSIEIVFKEILPVIDSFELGMDIDTKTEDGIETFINGQNATYQQFVSILDRFSIEVIDPKDMKFDANNHEAMSIVENDSVEPGYIVEVIQKGYRLQNRLLRPARVIVSSESKKD